MGNVLVVHLIRVSTAIVSYKDLKAEMVGLKPINGR